MRREGISTSQISQWRTQRDRGTLDRLAPQPRGSTPTTSHPLTDEVARLRAEHAHLADTSPAARRSPRALSPTGRSHIWATLTSERFVDCMPREVSATVLDAGLSLCSWSTMYRMLRTTGEVIRRRDQPRRTAYAKPKLLATGPNQLWSWDITTLKGPVTWTY